MAERGLSVAPDLEGAVATGTGLRIIATETGLHPQNGLQTLNLDLNQLVEEPFEINGQQARDLNEKHRLPAASYM